MPTTKQDTEFSNAMENFVEISVNSASLDHAIDWIKNNLNPEDVFTDVELGLWAIYNGFTK